MRSTSQPRGTPDAEVLERDEYHDLSFVGVPDRFARLIASRLAAAGRAP